MHMGMFTIVLIALGVLTTAALSAPPTTAPATQPDLVTGRPWKAPLPPLPPGVKVIEDIEYVPGGGLAQSIDLYLPEKRPEKPLPLVMWIHGGAWMKGVKNPGAALGLTQHGYIAAAIEYRFTQVAKFPAQIQDCQAAIRFLRAHADEYGIDPNHIGVWGNSAGGHLVNLLGTAGGTGVFPPVGGNTDQSDRVQAVCAECGPSDLQTVRAQAEHEPVKSLVAFNTPKDPFSNLIGVPMGQDPAKEAAASPVHYLKKGEKYPPFLLIHGTADANVPFAQAQEMADALNAVGADVLLQPLPGSSHTTPVYFQPAVLTLAQNFFDRALKGVDVKIERLPDEAVALPKPTTAPAAN